MKVWFILYYLLAGHMYLDYTLCYSQKCIAQVTQAAEADPEIYHYKVLRSGDELPPFQVYPPTREVWKNL